MKAALKPGLKHRLSYTVPESRTVPFIGDSRHERFVVTWDRFNVRVGVA